MLAGRQYGQTRYGKSLFAPPGSQAAAWYRTDCIGTWEPLTDPVDVTGICRQVLNAQGGGDVC